MPPIIDPPTPIPECTCRHLKYPPYPRITDPACPAHGRTARLDRRRNGEPSGAPLGRRPAATVVSPTYLRTEVPGPPAWAVGFDLQPHNGVARLHVSSLVIPGDGLRALAALAAVAADRLASDDR